MAAADSRDIYRWGYNPDQIEELDDWASEWAIVKAEGGVWGGRKRGGRGIRITAGMIPDIVVADVSIQFCGKTLLSSANLSFLRGHRYALVGPNGSGKSTLLRRMAKGLVPGFPMHLKVVYLQQEIPALPDDKIRAIDLLTSSALGDKDELSIDNRIDALKMQESELESLLDDPDDSSADPEEIANELAEITEKIEMLELKKSKIESVSSKPSNTKATSSTTTSSSAVGGGVEIIDGFIYDRVNKTIISNDLSHFELEQLDILRGLGLVARSNVVEKYMDASGPKGRMVEKQVISHRYSVTDELLMSMNLLSGGWRMRVSLAIALMDAMNSQVLLLDEATNHLDIRCIMWLQNFITSSSLKHCIIIMVSHDAHFMTNVATDIAELTNQSLVYFAGNYDEWTTHKQEMVSFNSNRLDAQTRKENHIKKSLEGNSKIKDKDKKLDRSKLHRGIDGKRFQIYAFSTDVKKMHLPEYITTNEKDKKGGVPSKWGWLSSSGHGGAVAAGMKFKFPVPDVSLLRLSSVDSSVIKLERCSFKYVARPPSTMTPASSPSSTNSSSSSVSNSSNNNSSSSGKGERFILKNVNFSLNMKSRVAVVGPNGHGKSTLIKSFFRDRFDPANNPSKPLVAGGVGTDASTAIAATSSLGGGGAGASVVAPTTYTSTAAAAAAAAKKKTGGMVEASKGVFTFKPAKKKTSEEEEEVEESTDRGGGLTVYGGFWMHSNLRVALVAQHHIDLVDQYLHETPVGLIGLRIQLIKHDYPELGTYTETDIRGHLGTFSISGPLALQPIGSLSGGQKARLAFSLVCLSKPHLLLLDEPTNNLSIEATEALMQACTDFKGAIMIVSHNFQFLTAICNELLVVENGSAHIMGSVVDGSDSADLSSSSSSSSGGGKAKGTGAKASKLSQTSTNVNVAGEATFEDILRSYMEASLDAK